MTLSLCLLLPAGLLLLAAAWTDLTRRIIPNGVSLGVALLGLGLRLADGSWAAAAGVAGAIFLAMLLCWHFGMVGGGDVKLLPAAALLVPPGRELALLLTVAWCGGLLALAYLVAGAIGRRRTRPGAARRPVRGALRRLLRIEAWRARRRAGLPYGCAIALGTLLVGGGMLAAGR